MIDRDGSGTIEYVEFATHFGLEGDAQKLAQSVQSQWRSGPGRPVDRPAAAGLLASEAGNIAGRLLCADGAGYSSTVDSGGYSVKGTRWPDELTTLAPTTVAAEATPDSGDALGVILGQQDRDAAEAAALDAATPSLIDRLGGRENIDWKSMDRFLTFDPSPAFEGE